MIKIKILKAKDMGFCFGVKRAVKITEETLKNKENVYIDGMLIHNQLEMDRLFALGLKNFDENDENVKTLILRSHGTEKNRKLEYLKNYDVIDTVCPKVKAVQNYAQKYQNEFLIIFGNKNHPEVKGINSMADYKGLILEDDEDIKKNLDKIKSAKKDIFIISQTTFKRDLLEKMLAILDENFIKYKFIDTICSATNDRVKATIEIAKNSDAVIVLGDKKSSNSTKLYEYAKQYCDKVFFVKSIEEIDISDIIVYNIIGITAGASTSARIIKEAIEKMEDLNKNEMMEAIESSFTKIKRGDILKGTVLYVTDTEVSVNINYRTDGIITREEMSQNPDDNPSDLFKTGDEIDVYVLKMDDGEGNVLLSHKRVQNLKNWDIILDMYNNNETVNAHVVGVNKGGLKCEVEGISAFMPASQVSINYKKDLSQFLDKDLASKVIDFNREKRRIIVSRKVVEEEELSKIKEKIYSELKEGDIITGTVQRLTNFGAFVDIGGIDGLIHISELSWNRVKHPSEVVKPGQEIQVKVLEVNPEKDRVALSLKQTTKEPWELFYEEYSLGDVVEGTVVNLLDFGAFIKLPTGVDGLLHVSQISKEHVEKPSDVLEIGQKVEVIITDINNEDRKISLSIKELIRQREKEARRLQAQAEKENQTEEKEASAQKPAAEEKPKEPVNKIGQPSFDITIGDLIKQDKEN